MKIYKSFISLLALHMQKREDKLYKVLLLGDTQVGKTCVFKRFSKGEFSRTLTTIGVDFENKQVQLEDNTIVLLQIWDTAGQERFNTMTGPYYRGASGIIIVYDITNKTSFANVNYWLLEVEKYNVSPDTIKLLIGNKCDLASERIVSYEEGESFAKENGISFLETSALNCENIEKAFYAIACKIHESKSTQTKPNDDKSEIIVLSSNKLEENVSWGDWAYSFC